MPQEPAYAAERRQDAGANSGRREGRCKLEEHLDRVFEVPRRDLYRPRAGDTHETCATSASVRRRGMGSPELMPQEVTLGRNRRVCGIETVGHMRSIWTTARAGCGYFFEWARHQATVAARPASKV